MAYQNVGTPRFYVDLGLYQQAIGEWTPDSIYKSFFQLNPTNVINVPYNQPNATQRPTMPRFAPVKYAAFLGHNGAGARMYPEWIIDGELGTIGDLNSIINAAYGTDATIEYNGFTIFTFPDEPLADNIQAVFSSTDIDCGAISFGDYYDMPHSPDLSLKLSLEYDGVKTIQTRGGATLSNATYTKPADWGDNGCWQLVSSDGSDNYDFSKNYRSGRRVWDLSFSYIDSRNIMPSNATTNNLYSASHYSSDALINDFGYTSDDVQTSATNNGAFRENILTSDDFFSQVWNKTIGGHLPFLFQSNGNLNLADQFAICRFDMNTLQYDQIAFNTYNVKLKIREVW